MAIANASKYSWKDIDLKDIQDILGRSLTDNDLRWILLAIDAENKTKSLRLTDCLGIMGDGLDPLRGSLVLERIDLSLVDEHENPTINPDPPISVDAVVPILESIISEDLYKLVHVQLPKKWRVEKSDILTTFLQNFDTVLQVRKIQCSGSNFGEACDTRVGNFNDPLVEWQQNSYEYGHLNFSCYKCRKNFCNVCRDNSCVDFCKTCEKYICQHCSTVEYCQGSNCSTPEQPASCKFCNVVKCW